MSHVDTPNPSGLLRRLNSWKPDVRAKAFAEMRRLSPETLLLLARQARRQYQKQEWLYFLGLPLSLFFVFKWHPPFDDGFVQAGWYFAGLCLLGGVYFAHWSGQQRIRHSLLTVLKETVELWVIPMALQMLRDDYGRMNSDLAAVLKALLPQLRAEHVRHWTLQEKRLLGKPLEAPFADVALTLRTLKALEQIGDSSALDIVRTLAYFQTNRLFRLNRIFEFRTGEQERQIQQAARECLPYLLLRAEEQRQSQTLLRSSGSLDEAMVESLLRPVASRADTTPDSQLLRTVSIPVAHVPAGHPDR